MNDHRPPDDIERLVRASLDRRAATLGTPDGGLDGVWERVDHRRARRRRVAAVGSLAVVGVGAVGIATLAGSRDPAPVADGPAPTDTAVPTTAIVAAGSNVWRCVDQIHYFGDESVDDKYYADCVAVTLPVDAQVFPEGPFASIPDVTAPPTTPPGSEGDWATTTSTVPIGPDGAVAVPPTSTIFDVSSPCASSPLVSTTTVPACTSAEQSYTVVAGDSIAAIAGGFGIDPQILANYNSWPEGIAHPIVVGDVILIPPGAVRADGTRIGSIDDSTVPTTTSFP